MLAALALGLGSLSLPASAQTVRATEAAPVLQALREAARELHLTPAQREALRPIVRGALAKARAVRADKSLPHRQKLAAVRAIRRAAAAEAATILTPGQLAQWRAIAAAQRDSLTHW
jgi:hypothetical protein